MASHIDALMGLVPPEQADQQALARQLRSDRNLGQFMGLSGNQQVRDMGGTLAADAMTTAQTAGTRRNQALTRTVAAEKEQYARGRDTQKDELDAAALERKLQGYSDVEWVEKDGTPFAVGTNNRTGAREPVPDSEGQTPYDKYAARGPSGKQNYRYTVQGSNEEAFANPTTKEVWFPRTGKTYKSIADLEIQEGIKLRASGSEAEAYAKKFGADTAAGDAARTESAYQNVDETGSLISDMTELLASVKNSSPSTSKFAELFPTFFGDTAYYESIRDRMALNNLKKWKLTPVSDKDLEYLVSATMPSLPRDQMVPLIEHRLEAFKKLQTMQEIEADFLLENGGKRPTRKQRAELKKELDKVMGGFDFGKYSDVYAGSEVEAIQGGGTKAPAPEEVAPKAGAYPAYITTPEQQAAWDAEVGQ